MSENGVFAGLVTSTNLVAGLLVYILVAFIVSLIRAPRYPTSIPWVGNGKGWVAGFKNVFGAIAHMNEWAQYGYETYSRKGQSYVLPGTFGVATEIVVPRSQMQWMLDQPDSILSIVDAHIEVLHGDYSFMDKNNLRDPFHARVVYKNLARNLNNKLVQELQDEVEFVTNEAFGLETEKWTKINLMDTLVQTIPKLTNRMLAGKTLSRNQTYIQICIAFTDDVVRNLLLLSIMPASLKKIVGPIASLPAKYHFWKTAKYTVPIIKQRLEDIRRKDAGEDKTWDEPNDYISWHIRTAQAEGREPNLSPKDIGQRLLILNFASIHTTALTAHAALLDILSTDPNLGVVQALREEAERVYHEEGKVWTKAGLSRLHKIDSAIRESMRFSNIATTMAIRKVVAPQGITNPEEGWHAPYGSFISCPVSGVHLDSELHDDAATYKPFRYSAAREEYDARSAEEKNTQEALRIKGTGMVTTSNQHFPFGHGRHTCPGRFFVAHELKMVLTHILMNYEVKHLDKRPTTMWIAKNQIPPTDACIEVRRKPQKAQ